MRVLLELRPAFDGHAGIPQEARLLFRGLRRLEGLEVEGLLQSSGNALARGLPVADEGWSRDKQLNRLSRVVVSVRKDVHSPYLAALAMLARQATGATEELSRFEAAAFRDFIWQALFARTLHADDFDSVTQAGYRVARVPWMLMHRVALLTRKLGHATYPRLDTRGFDVMIAETPYPARVAAGTRLVVRYHDAIPVLMPHTIADMANHQASHYHALRTNVGAGAHFACVSESTRQDLLRIFPQAEGRAVTIHNMVSHHYYPELSSPARVPEVIRTRLNDDKELAQRSPRELAEGMEYLLMVSTLEPRKNHAALLSAWEQLRSGAHPNLKLVIVGMLGWHHEPIIRKFRPWIERGELFVLQDVPSQELRLLYRHARATACPSFGEGFDFSGVEAMRCGGAVVASDIAVHREVFADAAEYFSPYSPEDLAQALSNVIDAASRARREDLVRRGEAVATRYLPDRILPQWREFLRGLPR